MRMFLYFSGFHGANAKFSPKVLLMAICLTSTSLVHSHNARPASVGKVLKSPPSQVISAKYRKEGRSGYKGRYMEFEPDANPPQSIDWRSVEGFNYVNTPGNQSRCGACYAFAAVAAIEAQKRIKDGGPLPELSVQQLVECSHTPPYRNFGCRFGSVKFSYDYYIQAQKGAIKAKFYPYKGRDNDTCHDSGRPYTVGARITAYEKIKETEAELRKAVGLRGPVPVVMNINQTRMYEYREKGVYKDLSCISGSVLDLNHNFVAIGYGTDPVEGKFWLLKNSWGTDWNDDGFIRVARDVKVEFPGGLCGIALNAYMPIVD